MLKSELESKVSEPAALDQDRKYRERYASRSPPRVLPLVFCELPALSLNYMLLLCRCLVVSGGGAYRGNDDWSIIHL